MTAEPRQDALARLPEDTALVDALRAGNEAAFTALVERYHPAFVRLALAYVHDRAVAEEVAQEAWLGMLRGLDGFAGRASLKTWLFRILINCARASHRRESRAVPFSSVAGSPGDGPAVEPERFLPASHRWAGHWATPPQAWPEEHLLAAEVQAVVRRVIAQLPPHQRAVLTLRDVEGWSSGEVCEVLEISEGNQRVLLHRARSRLRRELEAYLRQTEESDDDGDC